jgi:hypothetical protein
MVKDPRVDYQKVQATNLSREQQEQLRNVLRHELTETLIRTIKANPPDVNLEDIEIVLRPGQHIDDWNVLQNCETCSTCGTGGGIAICATSSLPEDIPLGVAEELGMTKLPELLDFTNLKRIMSRLERFYLGANKTQ